MSDSHHARAEVGAQSPRRRRSRVFRGVILALTGILAVYLLGSAWLGSVDEETVQCEVTDAFADQGDRFSAGWRVVIKTQNCGEAIYSGGVTRDNVDEVAADFSPGSYTFTMSLLSRLAADGYVPGVAPTVEEYWRVE